jgi:hypothetical protein
VKEWDLPQIGDMSLRTSHRPVSKAHSMNSCQVCWRTTEMAQRSNRHFLNLVSVEVLRDRLANREDSGRNPSWPGVADSTKVRIHWRRPNCHFQFSLATLRRTIHSDIWT